MDSEISEEERIDFESKRKMSHFYRNKNNYENGPQENLNYENFMNQNRAPEDVCFNKYAKPQNSQFQGIRFEENAKFDQKQYGFENDSVCSDMTEKTIDRREMSNGSEVMSDVHQIRLQRFVPGLERKY